VKASDPARPDPEAPREHFFGPAAMLALAVHVLLVAALVVGVHWQSRAPDVVNVELWRAPPEPAPPPPKVEPPAPPPPAPPKAEPRIEKPDIAVKEKPKPKPKPPPPKPEPKPVAKAKPAPPKPDESLAQQLLAQALAREDQQRAAERERQAIKDQLQREQLAAHNRAMATWVDKIRNQIRGNSVLPPDIRGNPQAEVLVSLLPTGDVLEAKLLISSGHQAYDDAVLRAILKSSPLPKPDTQDLFERNLQLKFRPKD
jgi:colicin import membrane protein